MLSSYILMLFQQMTFVGIILDGSLFRRVIIDFFVRAISVAMIWVRRTVLRIEECGIGSTTGTDTTQSVYVLSLFEQTETGT